MGEFILFYYFSCSITDSNTQLCLRGLCQDNQPDWVISWGGVYSYSYTLIYVAMSANGKMLDYVSSITQEAVSVSVLQYTM